VVSPHIPEYNMLFRKKKPKVPTGKIMGLKINGEDAKVSNIKVFTDKEGVGRCDIYAGEPKEVLHYEQSELEVLSDNGKKIYMRVTFDSAEQKKRVYIYHLIIETYSEMFA
jgi:hypothetical protein